jgi:flagellar hook-basal body complex protein FliE
MKAIATIQPPPRPLSPLAGSLGRATQTAPSSGIDEFARLMFKQVENVNTMQTDANQMVHSLLTGGDVNEAEVLTAVQKADLAFRMLLQVRNKLIEAYREVQQIQI